MPLPTSRNTTYAPGSQVKSADLNALQDEIIEGGHGDKILLIPATDFMVNPAAAAANYNAAASANHGWTSDNTNGQTVEAAIRLHVGDRISSLRVYLREANLAGEEIEVRVWESNPLTTAAPTQRGPTKTSGVTGAEASQTFATPNADFPLTLVDERHYVISVTLPVTSADNEAIVLGARIVYDRP